jgi:hypothetical protein
VNLELSPSELTGNGVIAGGDRVWSAGGTLYAVTSQAGAVQVYDISGRLVRTLVPGAGVETSVRLPKGVYVVRSNGKVYKVSIR